jgi:hypothetical protein
MITRKKKVSRCVQRTNAGIPAGTGGDVVTQACRVLELGLAGRGAVAGVRVGSVRHGYLSM